MSKKLKPLGVTGTDTVENRLAIQRYVYSMATGKHSWVDHTVYEIDSPSSEAWGAAWDNLFNLRRHMPETEWRAVIKSVEVLSE
jgi:hypothetical protein